MNNIDKISVIGAGSWGCALARILGDNGHEVLIYDIDEKAINEINQYHTNISKLFEGELPLNVKGTTNLEEVVSFSNNILLVVPTKVVRSVLCDINKCLKEKKLFINASKGIEPDTYKRVSEIVYEEINNDYIEGFVALTGPSHAEEVIKQKLTMVAAASEVEEHAYKVQKLFSNNVYFRVYRLYDLIGAELGGSLKNVYALGAGICEGLGFGVNARTALITRALIEMKKLAVAMGAKEETLDGLTGMGDLIVTCTSNLSRNYQAGVQIALGNDITSAVESIPMVVEGARTCISAYQVARKLNIDTPIINAIYNVLYNGHDPKAEIRDIMSRSLKQE